MSDPFYSRTQMLFGEDAVARFRNACVAVIGLGGVGAAAAEALARTGIGRLVLVDGDEIAPSNLNRQMFALHSTVGLPKTEAAARRIADINPDCKLTTVAEMLTPDSDFSFLDDVDYCIDAIDDVRAKLRLYAVCSEKKIPVIAAMGCGKRTDPTKLIVTDVFSVTGCPLCRRIRQGLRKLGIDSLPVVASTEPPREDFAPNTAQSPTDPPRKIASAAFVPNAAGLILASRAVDFLLVNKQNT